MNFDLSKSIEILERTPDILINMLQDISKQWTYNNEGGETWSAYDIVGHLIEGEKTDWIPRLKIMMSDEADKSFVPFDRFSQFAESSQKSLTDLLNEFKSLRQTNIAYLKAQNLMDKDFQKTGIHPAFGEVNVSQLLSTWAVHDLNHIAQIARVMAHQYDDAVGPWKAYLRILQ